MRKLCLLGALLMGLATAGAAELDWKPLEGIERTPTVTADKALPSTFTSWWFGLFPSAAIDFTSEPSGLFLLLK